MPVISSLSLFTLPFPKPFFSYHLNSIYFLHKSAQTDTEWTTKHT